MEWLHPMALRNSEAILFHPRDFGPGGFHGAEGRSGATRQADDVHVCCGKLGDNWPELYVLQVF